MTIVDCSMGYLKSFMCINICNCPKNYMRSLLFLSHICRQETSTIFIGRTDAEAEAPIPWPPDAKSQLIGKDSDAGED